MVRSIYVDLPESTEKPVKVLNENHICAILFILQRTSITNIFFIQIMLVAFVRYCVLLDCDSLMHADFIPLIVIHAWHPCFPSNGIKKYLT